MKNSNKKNPLIINNQYIKRICPVCNKIYQASLGRLKWGRQTSCSRKCSYKLRVKKWSNSKILFCAVCNKKIKRSLAQIKSKYVFCSIECQAIGRSQKLIISKVKLGKFVKCKTCGKEIYRTPKRLLNNTNHYCSTECGLAVQLNKKGLNKLELAGREILKSLSILFLEQILINKRFVVDALIDSRNLIIEWDGDYWHGNPKKFPQLNKIQKRKLKTDKSANAYLKKCGYTVLRFWEHDVYERPDWVKEQIRKELI